MLDNHQIMKIKTQTGNEMEIEVNYSEHKKVKNCQMLRIRINGEQAEIKKDDLLAVMMVVGSVSDQKKMMPMQLTKVRKLERMLTFDLKLKHNHKAGETITVQAPWIDTLEDTEEILSGVLKKKKANPLKLFMSK